MFVGENAIFYKHSKNDQFSIYQRRKQTGIVIEKLPEGNLIADCELQWVEMESRIFSSFVGLQKLVLAGESVIPVAWPCFYHIFTRNTTLIKGVDYKNTDKGIHLKFNSKSTLAHVKQGLKNNLADKKN